MTKYYSVYEPYYSKVLELICCGNSIDAVVNITTIVIYTNMFSTTIGYAILQHTTVYCSKTKVYYSIYYSLSVHYSYYDSML